MPFSACKINVPVKSGVYYVELLDVFTEAVCLGMNEVYEAVAQGRRPPMSCLVGNELGLLKNAEPRDNSDVYSSAIS